VLIARYRVSESQIARDFPSAGENGSPADARSRAELVELLYQSGGLKRPPLRRWSYSPHRSFEHWPGRLAPPDKESDMMLFDPRLFNAIWVAIACTAITVGLATVVSVIVSTITAIQVLRGKAERRPLIVEAYLQRPRETAQTSADVPGWRPPLDW
jgi:hypothetical protein